MAPAALPWPNLVYGAAAEPHNSFEFDIDPKCQDHVHNQTVYSPILTMATVFTQEIQHWSESSWPEISCWQSGYGKKPSDMWICLGRVLLLS